MVGGEQVVVQTRTAEGIRVGLINSRGSAESEFEFRVQNAEPGAAYRLEMNDQVIGTLLTDQQGRGTITLVSGEEATGYLAQGIAGRIELGAIELIPLDP